MDEYSQSSKVTLRDYLKIYFHRKAIIMGSFISVLAVVAFSTLLKTPVYEAQVTMLISAEKKIEAAYYSRTARSGQNEIALTQSEIVTSYPVLKRVVKALDLHKRPKDYEKKFASALRVQMIDLRKNVILKLKSILINNSKEQKTKKWLSDPHTKAIQALEKSISVAPVRNTNLLKIKIQDYDPVAAARIANVISRSYVIFDLEQQLAELQLKYYKGHQMVEQLRADVNKMIRRLTVKPRSNIERIGPASVKIIAPASVPLKPEGLVRMTAKYWMAVILVVFAAAFFSMALVLILEYMDQTFKDPHKMEAYLNFPYLGYVPKTGLLARKIVKNTNRKTSYIKAYQKLSDQMHVLIQEKKLKTVLVTSTLPGEGSDVVLANLGIFLSEKFNYKVLVMDANLRQASMHRFYKVPPEPGLADILENGILLQSAVKKYEPRKSISGTNDFMNAMALRCFLKNNDIHGVLGGTEKGARPQEVKAKHNILDVLPAGNSRQNPLALLSSEEMAKLMEQAKQKYKIVLINCASLRDFKDAEVISAYADGVINVVREGKTRRPVVKNAVKPWEEKHRNMLGLILNDRKLVIPGAIYKWL